MSDPINMSTLVSIAAVVTTLGTAWLTIRRVVKDTEKQKRVQSASILQAAKEADASLKAEINNRLHDLEVKLKVLKEVSEKDLAHLRETHNSELKNLGEKIEALRDELRQQSKSILELLTKMIGKE